MRVLFNGRTPAFQAGGEGSIPFTRSISVYPLYVSLAQLVRASGCGPEGHRFDPDNSPHIRSLSLFPLESRLFCTLFAGVLFVFCAL